MKKLDVPKIEPINVKQYEFKQSPYPQADKLPFRSIIVSASQGGKGILIQNLVLKIYRDCFERIWIVSHLAVWDGRFWLTIEMPMHENPSAPQGGCQDCLSEIT